MKIVNPKAEIIEDELSQLSIYQRIAYVAGVCYQREPNKTEKEAQAFCRKMVNIKHMSTLEMVMLHIAIPYGGAEVYQGEKFLQVHAPWNKSVSIVSGSIRAWMEVEGEYSSHVWNFLAKELPIFFSESDPPKGNIRWATPDEIPWQHKHVAVRFIVNRAMSHELVRHRPMSFLQESQRYCRYEDEVVFIRPEWWNSNNFKEGKTPEYVWHDRMDSAEQGYKVLMKNGLKPQQARAVLPNSTKTELIAYASLPQWKHVFRLRCSPAADPEMRRVMLPLEQDFKAKYPEAFE